ncbi:MAG: hypothetical protein ATN35_12790 [Epulopiscium sp. Nele67-Bin004]|nr:MAG: hypothetical protein ATN35_12790 [Epulopiscium sp. Nele67-Bin004]
MKKFMTTVAIGASLLFGTTSVFANSNISMYLNDTQVGADVSPERIDETLYVPVSTIANLLGITSTWESPNVTLTKDDEIIIITIGADTAIVNGQTVKIDAPAYINNGRTMVSVDFVAEAFNIKTQYVDGNIYFTQVGVTTSQALTVTPPAIELPEVTTMPAIEIELPQTTTSSTLEVELPETADTQKDASWVVLLFDKRVRI